MIHWFFKKFCNFFSAEVSTELAACEFDCRKEECSNEEFIICPRRLGKAKALKQLSEKNLFLVKEKDT